MAEGMLPPIVGHLMADVTGWAKGMATVKAETEAATGTAGKALTGLAEIGKIATVATVVSVAAVGVASLKMAGDFESATNRLVTSAGESRENIDMVRKGMLQMAGEVGYSAMELAKGMYIVESASFHGADGLKVLRAAAQGAKAENADLKVVADAVTSALIDYHKGADKAAQFTTTLIAAVSQGKTSFAELTGSLHSVLPIASAAGISLADITAAVASMTVHGMSADQATQNLAHTIQHLQTVTAPQAKELALLGINARELSQDLGTKGLTGTLQMIDETIRTRMGEDGKVILQMQDALRGLPPEVQKLGTSVINGTGTLGEFTKAAKGLSVENAGLVHQFATLMTSSHGLGQSQKSGAEIMQSYAAALKAATGDSTTLNTALMLTGENAEYTRNAVKAVAGATTEAGDNVAGWASIQATFNQRLEMAQAGLGALAITIGTVLIPYAIKAMDTFAAFGNFLSQHRDVSIALAGAIGGPLVVALYAATVAAIAFMASTIGIWGPIVLVILAAALLGAGLALLITHWGQVSTAVSRFIQEHTALAVAIGILLGPIGIIIGLAALLTTHWSQVTAVFNVVVGALTAAAGFIVAAWTQVVAFFAALPGALGGFFSALGTAVSGTLNAVWSAVTGFVGGVVGAIGGFFSALGTLASTAWAEFARHPFYWLGFVIGFVVTWAGQMRDAAVKAAGDFMKAVGDEIPKLGPQFLTWLGQVITNVQNWAGQMRGHASSTGQNFLSAIGDELGRLAGRVGDWLGNAVNSARGALDQLVRAGGQAASDFGTAIRNEWNKLPDQMWGIGVAVAQGVINGIKSMIGAGAGAVGDFVQGLVKGAKDASKSSSPSLVFAEEVGLPIAQGVMMGIQSGFAGARGALTGMIAPSSLAAPASSGVTGTPGGYVQPSPVGGSPTINVYVTTGADPQQIAREIAWAMKTG